ncbi:hypothetical protein ACLO87_12485 [Paenalcaligenes sp. Me52]|uniref:hypothetical protein n=1 Tax=Paenalcaligenes sp. Me52 TaxID=3392038 RepID=UPI003D2AFCF0
MKRFTALSLAALFFTAEIRTPSVAIYLTLVASDEGKAEGSVFLFGVQIKKYFRSRKATADSD